MAEPGAPAAEAAANGALNGAAAPRTAARHHAPQEIPLQDYTKLEGAPADAGHEAADEAGLKWAALERLPTFDRLRTGVIRKALDDGTVTPEQVDIAALTTAERAALVERVLETTDADNERLLAKMRERVDRVGLKFPAVEVRYEDLCVTAGVYVGSRALPSLLNFTRNMMEALLIKMHILQNDKRDFPILHNVSGVLRPGRMTLLLGPPGAGKSTLLKFLAGKLDSDLRSSGAVTYNGRGMHEFIPVRTAAYVNQNDNHIGEMTVRETLDFSARVQGAGYRTAMLAELEKREKEMGVRPDPHVDAFMKALALERNPTNVATDYTMKILGLDVCADTLVGNEMVRGISGGQKKRVTTGEMLVGPKQVLFMDEISTGLDSSTTFQITNCLRNITHLQDATMLIALLQPAPETYDLFDDILLLAEGHVVYHGPSTEIVSFFEGLGFACPPRKGVADFLQEVTSIKDQGQYWNRREVYQYVPVTSFAEAFRNSPHGQTTAAELKGGFDRESADATALIPTSEPYGLQRKEMLRAVFMREFLLMKRNAFLYIAQTLQAMIVALVCMTLFFRTRMKITVIDGNYFLGALFFSLLMMLFNGFAEMSLLVMRLPVFYKQRDLLLFPPWSLELPLFVLSVPYSLWAATVWTCLTYYVIGFAPNPGRFFRFILTEFLVHQMAIGLFRLVGAVGRHMVVANTFGSAALIVLFCLGGFVIAKNDIHPYWIWGFWASPVAYAMNCLTSNEFLANRWQKPAGGSYGPTETVGTVILNSRALFKHNYMFWVGAAALVGFVFVFNVLVVIMLMYLNPFGNPQPVISEDFIEAKHAARTGQSLAGKSAGGAVAGSGRARSRAAGTGNSGRLALERYREKAAASRLSGASGLSQVSGLGQASGLGQRSSLGQHSALGQPASNLSQPGSGLGDPNRVGLATDSALSGAEMGLNTKGMVLPFQALSLSFSGVNYYVDMPSAMKAEGAQGDRLQLLNDVSGAFRPGVLTALVGVSGAGKTTLMDVLAGRKTGGYIEGDIRVSGYPKVQDTFKRIMGYCEQFDIHSPQVTVLESLQYSAWLRLPQDVDKETRAAFVSEVMDLVELDNLSEALVGLPGVTGLSTEQRKRLTIAVELVANPSIIFMDEPTSGLDARAAAIVMRTVRNTVDTGRTVVCTIHQPSIDIFEAFDELLLMKRGGQLIYMGPLGKNSQIMVDYFQAVPGVPKLNKGQNPATWMLEISNPAAADRIGADFATIFQNSAQYKANDALIQELSAPPEGQADLHFPTPFSTGFSTQFTANLWKRRNMYWRSPEYNAVRYFYCMLVALLIGSVFFGLGQRRRAQQNILNIMGALYTCALFLGWSNGASVQPIVSIERTVFYRERASGYYSGVPYALAQGVIEIPYVVVQSVIYCLITYSLIHFEWTAPKFFWFLLFVFLTLIYFTYYGMMAISLMPNEQLAMVLSAFFFSLWNLFSGFLIPRPKMPKWWEWYYWCNPVAWTLYGLIASQLGDVTTLVTQPGNDKVQTVKEYLKTYLGYDHGMVGWVVLVLLAYTGMFFLVFALAFERINYQKR